uniref:Transmembrane protein 120 homolog n=1 Tax=Caenorhabditis tropicalis TaxID=1561998 RepID=A0A1I7UMI1_9PELO
MENEWKLVQEDFQKLEKIHDEYIQKSRQVSKFQDTAGKAMKHHNYLLKNLKETMRQTQQTIEKMDSEEEKKTAADRMKKLKEELEVSNLRLRDMQGELPAQSNGFYLNLILGSNLNISLLTKTEKFKYKEEYEGFKWNITILICVLALISWMWPFRVLDSILCFLMVWYYCTLTIRESVLRVNGSKIKGWWLSHHYLSCAVPGIVLTWKDGLCYQEFRPFFLLFTFYISIVQLAQNQYQSGCLRRLHSLGQGHQMDITVEGFTSWQFKGLTFLLPFLTIGYIIVPVRRNYNDIGSNLDYNPFYIIKSVGITVETAQSVKIRNDDFGTVLASCGPSTVSSSKLCTNSIGYKLPGSFLM